MSPDFRYSFHSLHCYSSPLAIRELSAKFFLSALLLFFYASLTFPLNAGAACEKVGHGAVNFLLGGGKTTEGDGVRRPLPNCID